MPPTPTRRLLETAGPPVAHGLGKIPSRYVGVDPNLRQLQSELSVDEFLDPQQRGSAQLLEGCASGQARERDLTYINPVTLRVVSDVDESGLHTSSSSEILGENDCMDLLLKRRIR